MRLRDGVAMVLGVLAVSSLAACSSSSKSSSTAASTSPTSTATSGTTAAALPTTAPSASTTTTSAGTANFDSCSVVTEAEAAGAIGERVTSGMLGSATVEGGLACVFYGSSAPTPRTPNVAQPDSVRVVVVKGADALRWYNDYKSKGAAQPISGFGDQAYYDGRASFSVLKGNSYLRIAVSPNHAAPSLTDEEHLATAVLGKL